MNHSATQINDENAFSASQPFKNDILKSEPFYKCSVQLACIDCLCCFSNRITQCEESLSNKTFASNSVEANGQNGVINSAPKSLHTSQDYTDSITSNQSPNIAQRRRHIPLRIKTKFIDIETSSEDFPTKGNEYQSCIELKSFEVQPSSIQFSSRRKSKESYSFHHSYPLNKKSNKTTSTSLSEDMNKTEENYFTAIPPSASDMNNSPHYFNKLAPKIVHNFSDSNDELQTSGIERDCNSFCSMQLDSYNSSLKESIHIGINCPRNRNTEKSAKLIEDERLLNSFSSPIDMAKLSNVSKNYIEEFSRIPPNRRDIRDLPVPYKSLNRYVTNIPIEETRIHLPPRNGDVLSPCLYINANLIKGYEDSLGDYIATEGPLELTLVDFWWMVWCSNAPGIVMLTELKDNKRDKCELYLPSLFPSTKGLHLPKTPTSRRSSVIRSDTEPAAEISNAESATPTISQSESKGPSSKMNPAEGHHVLQGLPKKTAFTDRIGSARINNQIAVDIECVPGAECVYGEINVKIISFEKINAYAIREVLMTYKDQQKHVYHIWVTNWKDHDAGPSRYELFELIKEIRRLRKISKEPSRQVQVPTSIDQHIKSTNRSKHLWNITQHMKNAQANVEEKFFSLNVEPSDGPLIVHCSAGLGRTGCFIAVDIGYDQLMREKQVDVMKIVSQMRLQRGCLVETHEQYEFIYKTLALIVEKLSSDKQPSDPNTSDPTQSDPLSSTHFLY